MVDLAVTIMEERLVYGIDMVKRLAEKEKIPFSEALFTKACEVGITLFIQKEKARPVSSFAPRT